MVDPVFAERLASVRKRMAAAKVDVLWVRSTDRWLNEYVPNDESSRIWLSGFTGSMGEAVVGKTRAALVVDGRYWLQAEKEADTAHWEIVKVPMGTGISAAVQEWIRSETEGMGRKKLVVGYEHAKTTPAEVEQLERGLGDKISLKGLFPSPVEQARGVPPKGQKFRIRALDEAKVGSTVEAKLGQLGEQFEQLGVEALLVQKLDEIAWLSNLRGDELPFQATFKSIALATPERLFVGIDPSTVPQDVRVSRPSIMFVPEAELWTLIGKKARRRRVGYDRQLNTVLGRSQIEATGAEAVPLDSPIGPLKAKKNPAELAAMTAAFARADAVIDRAIHWLQSEVLSGKKVSEKDFADKVTEEFLASGATGLSFKVISAAGKNGAVIHYSHPNPRRKIAVGELFLLDTGAYYEEGYATDLTRTFLVGPADQPGTDEQRFYFTTVLKGAIAGMSAVLPEGARGSQLDALVRAPLWAEGLDFNHGTGHGVGVNVHEFPPRIGPGAHAPIEVGHVFSIEPGVYLPKFGGVRIENLVTVVPAPGKPGFIAVQPLTFSPLDERLIEPKLLSPTEKAWLKGFGRVHTSKARAALRA
jgi:Xaa-Pro aminopeptidase